MSTFFEKMLGGTDRFRRNFLQIASANIIAQAVGLAAIPVLSRLYAPHDFGFFAIFTALQSVVLAISCARFEWLIPNARSTMRAAGLLSLALISLLIVSSIVAIVCFSWWDTIAGWLGLSGDGRMLLLLLPLGILGGGLQLALQGWHVFGGDLRTLSASKLAQSVLTILASVALGFAGLQSSGLVTGYIAGFWMAAVVLTLGQSHLLESVRMLTWRSLKTTLFHFLPAASSSIVLSMVNVLMAMSFTILLATFYSPTEVGWYSLVFRVATAPMTLITTALAHSFWADAADLAKTDPRRLRLFYLQSIKRLAVIGLAAMPVFLAGPLYVAPLFGPEWEGAGALLAAISPYLCALIVFGPTTHLIVYGKQHWQLVSDTAGLLAMSASFIAAWYLGAPSWLAVASASVISLAGYVLRGLLHLKANDEATEKFSGQRN